MSPAPLDSRQNPNNRLNQKNKMNEANKGVQLNNMTSASSMAVKSNNIVVNQNQLKNDTYESVCSPEDTAERTKVAQRHAIPVNGNGTAAAAAHISHLSGGTMPANGTAIAGDNRALKRVISAPVAANEMKGEINARIMKHET